jgi:hypothetical protein
MAEKKTKRKGFNFFRSYFDIYNELEDSDKIPFINALLDRQFLGKEPDNLKGIAKFAYISQKHSIDKQVKGFEDATGIKLNDTISIVDPLKGSPLQVQVKEQVKEQEEKVYSKEIHNCLDNCLTSFPDNLHPNETQKPKWLDTIDKLNRIDKIPYRIIESITHKVRADDFWSKNFMSLTKLRKNNKDGVKFIVVFYEQFKNKTNEKQFTDFTKSIREEYPEM